MSSLRAFAVLSLLMCAAPACSGVYSVGPGNPYPTPSDVPWESLSAGDSILIHARATPYRDKWVICRVGTAAAPIVVRGVPDPGGALPVIDGAGAATRPALNFWNEARCVIKVGGANNPPDAMPAWIMIENLEIRGARPENTFTGRDGLTSDAPNAAAVYIEKGEHVTVRGCRLTDCSNGLFCASGTRDLLVERCAIDGNGNVGSIYEHGIYTEALGITFQFNRLGPLRAGAGGNNLKDRSAGTVIRYNWIEGGNRQLDLVESDDAALRADPRYRSTFVSATCSSSPATTATARSRTTAATAAIRRSIARARSTSTTIRWSRAAAATPRCCVCPRTARRPRCGTTRSRAGVRVREAPGSRPRPDQGVADLGAYERIRSDGVPDATEAVFRLVAHPNPMRSTCAIAWTANPAMTGTRFLEILDVRGRLVARLSPSRVGRWRWVPPSSVADGVYFARAGSVVKRIVRLRP